MYGVVSFTFKIAQILVQSDFGLVRWALVLETTEPVSEPVNEMAVELKNNHLITVQQKDEWKSYILFYVKTTTSRF